MGLEQTLLKVEEDIEKGDLGKARDRLHGLIISYPNHLELRKKLGDVYWKLQYPAMAGRYWYFVENKTDEMTKACQLFEKECGYNPEMILRSLKFRGEEKVIGHLDAGKIVLATRKKMREEIKKEVSEPGFWERVKEKLAFLGCLSFLLLVIIVFIIGVITVIHWLGK